MEVLGVIGGVGSVLGVINSVTSIANNLMTLKERYDYAALNITLVSSSLWTVKAALEAIQKWRSESADSSQSSQQLDRDLSLTIENCALLVKVIERKIGETELANPSVLDRVRFVNLDNILKDFVANLDHQVRALQLLLTIFQWYAAIPVLARTRTLNSFSRTMTERTEKLQRRDTRKVFRAVRESTASLEYEDGDLEGAASILSNELFVDLEIDPILLKSKVYQKYHHERYQRLIKNFPSRTNSTATTLPAPPGANPHLNSFDDPILAQNFMLPFLGIPFKGEAVPDIAFEEKLDPYEPTSLNPIVEGSSRDMPATGTKTLQAMPLESAMPGTKYSAQDLKSSVTMGQADVEETTNPTPQITSSEPIKQASGDYLSHTQGSTSAVANPRTGLMAYSPSQEYFRPSSQASSRRSWHASDVSDLYSDGEEEVDVDSQEHTSHLEKQDTLSVLSTDLGAATESNSVTAIENPERLVDEIPKGNPAENGLNSSASRPDSDLSSIINFGTGPVLDIVTPGRANNPSDSTLNTQPIEDVEDSRESSQNRSLLLGLASTKDDNDSPAQPEQNIAKETFPDEDQARSEKAYGDKGVIEEILDSMEIKVKTPIKKNLEDCQEQLFSARRSASIEVSAESVNSMDEDKSLPTRSLPKMNLAAAGRRRVSTSSMPTNLGNEEDSQDPNLSTSMPIRAATVKTPAHRPPPLPPKRPPPPVPPRGVKSSKIDQAPKEISSQFSSFEIEPISGLSRSKLAATPYGQGLRSPRQPSIQEHGPEFRVEMDAGSPKPQDRISGRSKSSSTVSKASTLNESVGNRPKSRTNVSISSRKSSAPPSIQSDLLGPTESVVDSGRSSLNDRSTYITKATSLSANVAQTTGSPEAFQPLRTTDDDASSASSEKLQSLQNDSFQLIESPQTTVEHNLTLSTAPNAGSLLKDSKQGKIMSSLGILMERTKAEKSSNRLSRMKLPSKIKLKQPSEKSSNLLGLAQAASSGNASEIRKILKTLDKASDVDILFTVPESKLGSTPLMRAATGGHLDCMEALTAHCSNCTVADYTGATALHYALRAGNIEAAQWLLRYHKGPASDTAKASGEVKKSNLLNIKDSGGITPVHLAATLRSAETLVLFIQKGGDAHVSDSTGKTPLHYAIQNHSLPCVEYLVQQVKSKIEKADYSGETPLMLAAKVNGQNSVRFLLENGVDKGKRDLLGNYAIHHAAQNGHLTVLETLFLKLDDLELENHRGERPLHLAALGNHSRVVRALLRIGCQVNPFTKPPYLKSVPKPKVLDPSSIISNSMNLASTPLHYACCKGSYDNVDLLIRHGGMLNANQEDGTSPLMLACAARSPGLVELLLRSGANPNAATSRDRTTALHISVRRNDVETTKQLVSFGADTRAKLQNRWQESPSGLGMRMNGPTHRAAAEWLIQHHQNLWNRHVSTNSTSQLSSMPSPPHNASSSMSDGGSYQYVNLTTETRRATGAEVGGFFSSPTQAVTSPPSYEESLAATRNNLRRGK